MNALRQAAKAVVRRVPWLRRQLFASTDYAVLTPEQARRLQLSGWSSARTAARQDKAYTALLRAMHAGEPRVDLKVAADVIRHTGIEKPSILEIGCGSGYYFEVFSTMLNRPFEYVGIDYSASMIEAARARYPGVRFEIADACRLPFEDASFGIVFNGVCLMHILDFEAAIAEARRVARSFCVFHSVPLFQQRKTTYLSKYAYGAPVVEIVFNRKELLATMDRHGLELVASWPSIDYDVYPVTGEHSFCETLLLRLSRSSR